jgi:hypothetical protein
MNLGKLNLILTALKMVLDFFKKEKKECPEKKTES